MCSTPGKRAYYAQRIVYFYDFIFCRRCQPAAEVPSDSQEWLLKDEPPVLIQVKEPQVIFARGRCDAGVAELNPSHGFYIYPMKGEFRELQFGNDRGFIGSEQLSDKT